MTTQADLDNWFTYHAPVRDQQARYVQLRESAKLFAQLILALTPSCADQTAALRLLRECVMTANASIACEKQP